MAQTPAQWLRLFEIEPIYSDQHQAYLFIDPDDPLDFDDLHRLGGSEPVYSVTRPALRDVAQVFLTTSDGLALLATSAGALVIAEVGVPT